MWWKSDIQKVVVTNPGINSCDGDNIDANGNGGDKDRADGDDGGADCDGADGRDGNVCDSGDDEGMCMCGCDGE